MYLNSMSTEYITEVGTIQSMMHLYTFDFDRLNAALPEDKRFSTVRNLTAGTVRAFDPKICQSRSVRFSAFKVLEGMLTM